MSMPWLTLLPGSAAAVAAMMVALWLTSLVKRDVSIVDPWWSIGCLVVAVRTALASGLTPGRLLLLTLVTLWALRLFCYLLWRGWGEPEDPRYQAFRERYGPERYRWLSLFQVFMLQGVLILIVSAPLQVALTAPTPDPIRWNDGLGLALFALGFGFEVLGDWQLARFKSDPANRGRVLDRGVWRLTRHPNYFGEATLWWGLWLCAVDAPGGIVSVFAPALMTFLLLRVSGVPMLEEQLKKTKPAYAEYIRRTSAFFPRPPRD